MKKGLLITGGILVVAVGGWFLYGHLQKKKFDKDCLAKGGKVLESGKICSNK